MTASPRILCLGTHHKTGTTWMKAVFFAIAETLDIPVRRVPVPRDWAKLPAEGRVIATNWRSRFHRDLLANPQARVLHVIRDPRDVLISGARYHETTSGKFEKFLYNPRDELDGKSYQQHLRSLPSVEEKLAFEMGGKHLDTLKQMLDWDYDNPRSFEARYEDLIADTDGALFGKVLTFLGFSQDEVETGVRIFKENSLFGTRAEAIRQAGHVASGRPAQWISRLPRSVAELYAERHGADLIRLGYENDMGWIDRLDPAPELAATGS